MKILLLSDTHGYFDEAIINYAKDCDEIWHAGDIGTLDVLDKLEALKPTIAVYGNIDGTTIRKRTTLDAIIERNGLKIYITHIGGYPGRYNPRAREIIDREHPGLFICGHSHILKVMHDPKRKGLLHMNPGAMGKQGFHKVRTMLRFDIADGRVRDAEVIEF